MPRYKQNSIIFTKRDFAILTRLFEHKTLSRTQIQRDYFRGSSKSCVNTRLKKLSDIGLIDKVPIQQNGLTKYFWFLTPKGLNKIKLHLPYKVTGRELKSSCPIHDSTLHEIRRTLEVKKGVVGYYTENALQNSPDFTEIASFKEFVALNSDAVASIRLSIGIFNFAVEYERSAKRALRYSKKLSSYYGSKIQGVFYICKDESILKSISRVEANVAQRYDREPLVRYALIDDVLCGSKEIKFKSLDGTPFTLA